MPASPNVENLSLMKGVIKFLPEGEGAYVDLGECSAFTTTIGVDTLDYISRRHSSRIPVKTIVLGKTMTFALTMSEFSNTNIGIWAQGDQSGSPLITTIGTKDEVRGSLRFIGQNTVGVAYQVDLYDVLLRPNGALDWLSDNQWSEMVLEGTVNANQTTGSFGDIQEITAGVEVPMGSPPL